MVNFSTSEDFSVNLTDSWLEEAPTEFPTGTAWFSSSVLLLVSLVGLPLNGTTVIIFWRRKKLRHLVNFVLLLDCLSHIVLCLIGIPIHVVSVWTLPEKETQVRSVVLLIVQQVVGNFANLCGLLLTLSIAILRYRRLCWKKKDKFSTMNAIKWSVTSGTVAIGLTIVQSGTSLLAHPPFAALTLYSIKLAVILLSILAVFFCYIRVAQRVWSSGASQEKVMDATKLKKSRSVHMRATIHSCVQIVLVVATLSPYLYEETVEVFKDPNGRRDNGGLGKSIISGLVKGLYSYSTIDKLWSITINYTLLILGTPLAYIASCHRFREQFTSLIFGHSPNTCLNHPTQQSGSPGQVDRHASLQQHLNSTERTNHHNNNYPHQHNLSTHSSSMVRDKVRELASKESLHEEPKRSRNKGRRRSEVSLDTKPPTLAAPTSNSSPSTSSDQSDKFGQSSQRSSGSSFTSHNTTTMGTLTSSSLSNGSSVNIIICVPFGPATCGPTSMMYQQYLLGSSANSRHDYGHNV
ncbi:unnamed protein product [Allacma fusca]|uniref:G-protein coupled receptors family 1 profile domain-containing protein n=1 Tax=Allacma fusca TaxID=39272 RepID=A0A8J2L5V0_9HEXA|nr:unnamed protein product [Allacma fusca]